ncbi:MAG: DUF192 domain-containing protein, partial [Gemmatimonadota bacterium]|nr:DUF192 domain-containing protein [Gemmatimonadota bacterium]
VAVLACSATVACGFPDAGGSDAGGSDAAAAVQEGARGAADVEEAAAQASGRVPIRVAGIPIEVEIADDEDERARGLMFRESLPEDHGMLFVYESERRLGFWMKNTLIPLDIAYADRAGRIVDIKQMEPQSTETVYSSAPAMYALEMNQGWFEAHGVSVGDRIEF